MESKLEFPPSAILTPYNYFEWKPKIQLHLRSRGLFRITMETEVEPTSAVEKSRYFNRMDEAFGILCLSISPELLFHVESCSTPNEVWKILEELFGKQNEMLKMVEDSIAIYRNCRESFRLEPEDPHVASMYATNYVQGLLETHGGDPNRLEVAACYDDDDEPLHSEAQEWIIPAEADKPAAEAEAVEEKKPEDEAAKAPEEPKSDEIPVKEDEPKLAEEPPVATKMVPVYAVCRPYGSSNNNNVQSCMCVPGFVPKDSREWESGQWTSGCVRKTPSQCSHYPNRTTADGFVELSSKSMPPAGRILYSEQRQCEEVCLGNCLCTANAYVLNTSSHSQACVIWFGELLNLYDFAIGTSLFFRLDASDEPTSFSVKAEGTNMNLPPDFQKTRLSYTLDEIEGPLEVSSDGKLKFEEKDSIDYAAVTVQLPGDERVPFLFTVKQLVASGTPESFSGQFLMPAYRGFYPNGRGGSTGYDNAVALPAGGRGDEDELAKENIKVVSASKGSITLSVSKSKPETHEVIGVFESLQPSDTDLGSTAPKDVKIQGIWYAQLGKALALLALGSAITVTPCEIDSG